MLHDVRLRIEPGGSDSLDSITVDAEDPRRLGETAITVAGGVFATGLGFGSRLAFEAFNVPSALSALFVFAALGCAVGTGFALGIVPARRAAALDPAAALAR